MHCRAWYVVLNVDDLHSAIIAEHSQALGIALVVASATTVFEWEAQLKADRPAGVAHSAVSFILDSSITIVMVYLLRRNRTEYVQTTSIIGKLVVFILSTNLFTALLGLTIFIIVRATPHGLSFGCSSLPIVSCLPKRLVHCTTLLPRRALSVF
jgi:hypothetical protein